MIYLVSMSELKRGIEIPRQPEEEIKKGGFKFKDHPKLFEQISNSKYKLFIYIAKIALAKNKRIDQSFKLPEDIVQESFIKCLKNGEISIDTPVDKLEKVIIAYIQKTIERTVIDFRKATKNRKVYSKYSVDTTSIGESTVVTPALSEYTINGHNGNQETDLEPVQEYKTDKIIEMCERLFNDDMPEVSRAHLLFERNIYIYYRYVQKVDTVDIIKDVISSPRYGKVTKSYDVNDPGDLKKARNMVYKGIERGRQMAIEITFGSDENNNET